MSPRTLKIALAVSVALNLFAVAGAGTAWVTRARVDERVEDQRRPGRENSVREIVAGLDPEVRDRVKTALRASALAARPDFEEAREARREAIALTRGAQLDPAAATALLERSRTAEMRGRTRLEQDSVALLATLDADDRQALGVILNRHGRGRPDHDRSGKDGPRPADGKPTS